MTQSQDGAVFGPGQKVSKTGIYRAVHRRHRLPHEITMVAGETFPNCKKCGAEVRFELVHEAERMSDAELLVAAITSGLAVMQALNLPWLT